MTIKTGHPRCWLTSEKLTYLRANPGRLEWKRLMDNCQIGFDREAAGLPFVNADGLPIHYDSCLNYALAYQVTGQTYYHRMAVKLVEIYMDLGTVDAMNRIGATGPHGFGARIVIPEAAITYDWLYSSLPAATRKRWADQIMAWCDSVWLETNPNKGMPPRTTPSTVGQTWPGDNFYAGNLMTLLAAIVLSGEHPRAQTHVDLGLKKLSALRDYLAQYSAGGISLEGTNYGSWLRHAWLFAALLTATGYGQPTVGPIADPQIPIPTFLMEAAVSRWHLTTPDRKHLIPYGGQPVAVDAPIVEDHTGAPLVALSHGDAPAKAWAKSWLDSVTFTRKRQNSWMPALWYDNRVTAAKVATLPTAYLARGSGTVTMRSGWGTDETLVYFVCGPTKENHQEYAAGTFGIQVKGEWLTGPARLWGLGGELLPSEYHNVILVKQGTTVRGQPAGPMLPKDEVGVERLTSITGGWEAVGDATKAYDFYKWPSVRPLLERWTRQVTFVGKKITVVDEIVKLDPLDEILWQLQCKNEPTLGYAGRYEARGEKAVLSGKSTAQNLSAVPVMKGKGGSLSSWTLLERIPGGSKEVTITNVLEILPL